MVSDIYVPVHTRKSSRLAWRCGVRRYTDYAAGFDDVPMLVAGAAIVAKSRILGRQNATEAGKPPTIP